MFLSQDNFLLKKRTLQKGCSIEVFNMEENIIECRLVHTCEIIHFDFLRNQLLIVDVEKPQTIQVFHHLEFTKEDSKYFEEEEEEEEENEEDKKAFKHLIDIKLSQKEPNITKISFLDPDNLIMFISNGLIFISSYFDNEQTGLSKKYEIIELKHDNQNENTTYLDFGVSPFFGKFACFSKEDYGTRLDVYSDFGSNKIKTFKFENKFFGGHYLSKGVGGMFFSSDGKRLILSSFDGCYFFFFNYYVYGDKNDYEDFEMFKTPFYRGRNPCEIRSISFSNDMSFFTALSDRKTVHIFSLMEATTNPNALLGGKLSMNVKSFATYRMKEDEDFSCCKFSDVNNDICLISTKQTIFVEFDETKGGECGESRNNQLSVVHKKGHARIYIDNMIILFLNGEKKMEDFGTEDIEGKRKLYYSENFKELMDSRFEKRIGILSDEDYFFTVELQNGTVIRKTTPINGKKLRILISERKVFFDILVDIMNLEGTKIILCLHRLRSTIRIMKLEFQLPERIIENYLYSLTSVYQNITKERLGVKVMKRRGFSILPFDAVVGCAYLAGNAIHKGINVGFSGAKDSIVEDISEFGKLFTEKNLRTNSNIFTAVTFVAKNFGRNKENKDENFKCFNGSRIFSPDYQFKHILVRIIGYLNKKEKMMIRKVSTYTLKCVNEKFGVPEEIILNNGFTLAVTRDGTFSPNFF